MIWIIWKFLRIFTNPWIFEHLVFWIYTPGYLKTFDLGSTTLRISRSRASKARHVCALIASTHVEFRPLRRTEKHWPSYVGRGVVDCVAMHLSRSPRQRSHRASSLFIFPSLSTSRHSGIRFANRNLFAKSRKTVQIRSFFKRFALSAWLLKLPECLIALYVIGSCWLT